MPIFSLRPVFVGWSTLVSQIPFQLFFTIWGGGFFGGLIQIVTSSSPRAGSPMWICGAIVFVSFPIIVFVGKRFNYKKTEYKFYEDRLEFEEGFWTINKKVIHLKDVREVTLRQGIFQRATGLGTIYLGTTATGSSPAANPFSALNFGSTSASGISVRDVINPEAEYERIRKIVDAAR